MLERNNFRIRVIEYYSNRESRIISFFRDSSLTEDEFLDTLLHNMRRECLEDLERLSICQFVDDCSEVYPWLESCGGRVYKDGDDLLSIKFRNKINELLNNNPL